MSSTYFIHIGCTYAKEEILSSLCSKKERLLVVDDVGLRSKTLSCEYLSVYSYSFQEIIDQIDSFIMKKRISEYTFFTLAEGSVDLLNKILKHYKKKPISELSVRLRNKFYNRKRLEDFGIKINTLNYIPDILNIPLFSKAEFPLIVKPVESMESRGVSIAKTQSELQSACLRIFSGNKTIVDVDHGQIVLEQVYNETPGVLIESKIEGEKVSIEALVINGEILFKSVTKKYDFANSFFYERADIIYNNYSQDLLNKAEEFLEIIVKANFIISSILHIEAFLNPITNELQLIEVNYRLGGGHIHELIKKKFKIDLLNVFLQLSLNPSNLQPLKSFREDERIWVSFDFITTQPGTIDIKLSHYKDIKIHWEYESGSIISKFENSSFFKLGTVIFSVENLDDLNQSLFELDFNFSKYYDVRPNDTISVESENIEKQTFSSEIDGATKRIFALSILVFFILVFTYFIKIYHSQIDFLTDTLSKTLSTNIVNGEVYAISNTVNNFKSQKWFKKIVVTDSEYKVIYSIQDDDTINFLYRKTINKSDLSDFVEIRSNGINVGWLFYKINYSDFIFSLIIYIAGFIFISFSIYYFVIRTILIKRISSVHRTVQSLISVSNELKRDIESIYDGKNTFQLEKYKFLLGSDNNDKLVTKLKEGVYKLVILVPVVRNLLFQKQELSSLLEASVESSIESQTKIKIGELASQVAHDIRSPLSALTMMTSGLEQIPEDRRIIIRNAISRINDIANTLLKKSKEQTANLISEHPSTPILQVELVATLIDMLVSEKRIEFREFSNIKIQEDLLSSYGLFAKIDANEFKRILSNLINNSFEALNGAGLIQIAAFAQNDKLLVQVSDNGQGIPPEILVKLGQRGVTFGKDGSSSGTGIGIYHAKQMIETFGGSLTIKSIIGQGTVVSIELPLANTPDWFVEKISIQNGTTLVSLDDDTSIHQIWKDRASNLDNAIPFLSFASIQEFTKWFTNSNDNCLFVIDYEFLNQKNTGLDVIETLNIQNHSILVTSRYEEKKVRERCAKLGVKLIPKSMAGIVPMALIQLKN
jgi:signal transduction histidine kinase